MPKIENRDKRIAWVVSSTLGFLVLTVGYAFFFGKPLFDDYILIAVAITIFPQAVLEYLDYRWRRAVDENLPDFLESIAQAQRTGMSFPRAIEEASKRRYGPLTSELKRMVAQMSWGMPLEDAFRALGERVGTILIRRTFTLLIVASRYGGRIERSFDPLARFIRQLLALEKDRRTEMTPYTAVIYIAFYVFLFIIIMLFRTFLLQMPELPTGLAILRPEEAQRIFFHLAMIQALFSGLVAGKMGEGSISAGLKHSTILLVTGYLALRWEMIMPILSRIFPIFLR